MAFLTLSVSCVMSSGEEVKPLVGIGGKTVSLISSANSKPVDKLTSDLDISLVESLL